MTAFTSCADLDEVAEELALGTLHGVDRAGAIAHLNSCARCRRIVDDLTETGEALLLLAPEEEPPLGFESRVAAEIVPPQERQPHRRWRRLAIAAAVVAAAGLGVVAGNLDTTARGRSGVQVALVTADGGRATCHAVVIPGRPAQLVVTIDEAPESDPSDYFVEAQGSGGTPAEAVGTLRLVNGHGALSAPLGAPGDAIRAVRVFQSGQLRYEAQFGGDA
jgi:hypothetical protein